MKFENVAIFIESSPSWEITIVLKNGDFHSAFLNKITYFAILKENTWNVLVCSNYASKHSEYLMVNSLFINACLFRTARPNRACKSSDFMLTSVLCWFWYFYAWIYLPNLCHEGIKTDTTELVKTNYFSYTLLAL